MPLQITSATEPSRRAAHRWRLAIGAAWAAAAVIAASYLSESATAAEVTLAGPSQVLFDQREDRCPEPDGPDAPAIAFRNAQGEMVLFATSFRNRAFVGPSLAELRRDCRPRFQAARRPEPGMLDDRTWLHAVHTLDGVNVFALGSAGFMPSRHAGLACGAGTARTDCWYNGIVALRSEDGGVSFRNDAPPPRHALLAPPAAYDPSVRHPAGFITATNLVPWRGHVHTVVRRRGEPLDASATCVFRAARDDLSRWEMWDGSAFVAATVREAGGWRNLDTRCAGVGSPPLRPARGLVLHEASQTFVAVYEDRTPAGEGVFYRTSRDLVSWAPARLLLPAKLRSSAGPDEPYIGYPSIIDETSADRNFGTAGPRPALLHTRIVPATGPRGQPARSRQLVATPIAIAP